MPLALPTAARPGKGRAGPAPSRPAPRTEPLRSGDRWPAVAVPGAACPCGGGCPRCRGVGVHLTRTGDPAERGAERAAQRVLRVPAPSPAAMPPRGRRPVGVANPADTAALPPAIQRGLRSAGRPLDAETRAFMEPRFGFDLSGVRVHSDAAAAASARAVSARAFAFGRNIVFGEGQYRPSTGPGRELMAHELAHVVAPAAAPAGRPVVHRQPAPTADADPPSLVTIFVTTRRPDDAAFARRLAREDAARLRRIGHLSAEDRQEIDAKLRFFQGAAWAAYGRVIKPALERVVPPKEIEMPGEYVGRPAPPEDVLNAILAILQGALPGAARAQPGDGPRFEPDYYLRNDPAMGPYAGLLRDWYEIAHEWVKSPDPQHPNLMIGVTGDIALTRIGMAVRETTPLVTSVAAAAGSGDVVRLGMEEEPNAYYAGQRATGGELIMRYLGMVDWLTTRAQGEAEAARRSATEADLRARIYGMDSEQIYDQWKDLNAEFVAVASAPDNRLSTQQLFDIWKWYWADRRTDGNRRVREIEHAEATQDIHRYVREMSDFEDGNLDALGPVYRQARADVVTGTLMLNWAPEIRAMVFDGKTHTLQEINQKALIVAKDWQRLSSAASGIAAYYPGGLRAAAEESLAVELTAGPEPPPPEPAPAPATAAAGDQPAVPYQPGHPLDDTQPMMAFEDTDPGVPTSGGGGGGAGGGAGGRRGDTLVSHPPPMPRPPGRGPTAGPAAEVDDPAAVASGEPPAAEADPYLDLLKLKNERVAGYAIRGAKALFGKIFVRRILVLQRIGGPTTDIRPLMGLFEEFAAEARAAGATELRVTGLVVKNPNVMRMQRIGRLLGGTIRPIDAHTIEVTVPLGNP